MGINNSIQHEQVAVIMPVFNGEKYLSEAIDSVLNQTYKFLHLLIVDDASTDSSVKIINNYVNDPRVTFIGNEVNIGPLLSRNLAIRSTNARFIAFLDQDDFWAINKLELQISFMCENNIGVTYTNYYKFESTDRKSLVTCPPIYNIGTMFKDTGVALSSFVYDTSIVGKVYFDNARPFTEFGFLLRLMAAIKFANSFTQPLLYYRITDGSISRNKLKMALTVWGNYRGVGFGPIISMIFFVNYAIRGLFRHLR